MNNGTLIQTPPSCASIVQCFRNPPFDDPLDEALTTVHPVFLDLDNFAAPATDPQYVQSLNAVAGSTATGLGGYPELRTLLMRVYRQLGADQIPSQLR